MYNISHEDPVKHADAIEALYDVTFGPGHFAKTAERLRENNQSLPELNRVAIETDGTAIGAVRLWPVTIETGGAAVFVGPVAVHPTYRGQKLGLRLCELALNAARDAKWGGAIIIGSPTYFADLGFAPVEPGRIIFPGPQDMARVMRLNLCEDTRTYAGRIIPHSVNSCGGQFA